MYRGMERLENWLIIIRAILQENCKMRIKILTVKNNRHIIIVRFCENLAEWRLLYAS